MNKKGVFELFKKKKADLGIGITGLVSLLFIVFILIIFLVASALIAGAIHIPFLKEEKNSVDIDSLSGKEGSFEIKKDIISILNSRMENGESVKDNILKQVSGTVYPDNSFSHELIKISYFYIEEDFCLKISGEKRYFSELDLGRLNDNEITNGCVSSITGYKKDSLTLLENKEKIKIELFIEK